MLGWLTKLDTVHKAETDAEREAVYRFPVPDLHRGGAEVPDYEADHEPEVAEAGRGRPAERPRFYTGRPDDITSTVRVRAWKPGEVPPAVFALTSMDRFPGIEGLGVSHIGRMMIRRSLRGKLVLPSLLAGGYPFLVGEKGADLAFLDCVPGIVRHYRQLGRGRTADG